MSDYVTHKVNSMIEILTAFKEGKAIQYRNNYMTDWKDVLANQIPLNWVDIEYRVKREPRTFWLLFIMGYQLVFLDKREAENYINNLAQKVQHCELIEVVEK